ncbi:MAG: thioredoxin domain-containing protein, partial [Myxococcales bacterium]|nr:thioredoxin domain-containing protein [Myxococcales bacterium]
AGESSEECSSIKVSAGLMSKKACAVALADLGDLKAKMAEAKKPCADLANKLCADLGETTKTCAMVREKTPSFPVTQCNEMLTKYDTVIADLKKMEAANQPLTPEQQAKLAAGDAPSWGPADAKVTIVEFSDFQCPYCSRAAEAEKALKAKYEGSGSVRFIFRQFPLSFHQEAMPAAVASLEAHAQGKFWEFHDLLFQNQKELSRATIEKLAGDAGLDVAAVKAALDENRRKEQAEADMKLGEEVGVQGTPSMFVGGERVQNPGDVEAISKMIDEALAKAATP